MIEDASRGDIDLDLARARIEEFQREKAAAAEQRKEISILIKQAVAEIERLALRNRDLASLVRQMEANLEAQPRSDLKQVYSQSQEAQMRLFMMQGQLEQLRFRHNNLEKIEQMADRVLEMAGWLVEMSASQKGGQAEGAAGSGDSLPAASDAAMATLKSAELAQHRLSRQLQDICAQAFADLVLRAEVSERLVEVDQQMAKEEIAALRKAAVSALKSTRQMVYELQPPALEELGLVAALRRYVETSRPAEMLHIDVQVSGQERRLPQSVELALFRIVQEALSNAAQHSGTRRAEVSLRFETGQVVATVTDEGYGFDVESTLAEAAQKAQSSGLADMQLRAHLAGGSLEIGSRPGAGCMISVAIPA